MSQYPPTPSYAGSANYAPQWPAHPPQSSSDRPDSAFYGMNTSLAAGNYATIPFNPNPPTQLPGLGMAKGLVSSPYLPQNLPDSQMSVPFGARLNGAGAYPPDNSLSTPPFGLSQPLKTFQPLTSHPAPGSYEHSLPPTQIDTDREEGEVSDFSGNDIAIQSTQPSVRSKLLPRARAEEPSPPRPVSSSREIYSAGSLPMQGNHNYDPTSISSSDNNQSREEGSESRKAHF